MKSRKAQFGLKVEQFNPGFKCCGKSGELGLEVKLQPLENTSYRCHNRILPMDGASCRLRGGSLHSTNLGKSRLVRETICSLSGFITLQHLTALLLGEDASPQRAEASLRASFQLWGERGACISCRRERRWHSCPRTLFHCRCSLRVPHSAVANPPGTLRSLPCPLPPGDRADTAVALLGAAPAARPLSRAHPIPPAPSRAPLPRPHLQHPPAAAQHQPAGSGCRRELGETCL